MYCTRPLSTASSLMFSNKSNTDTKPFYLYKGLTPEKEESLKIYPVDPVTTKSSSIGLSSVSSVSSTSSSLSSATTNTYHHTNEMYSLPTPPGSTVSFTTYKDTSSLKVNNILSPTSTSSDHEEHDHSESDTFNDNELIQEIRSRVDHKVKYKCNYPGCHYKGTFLSKDYLRRHIREQHRRSKDHICSGYHPNGQKWGCNKKFSRPYQLVNHWRGQRSLKRCGVPETELRKYGIL